MILDISQNNGCVYVSYYDKDGNVAFKQYDIKQPQNWVVIKPEDKNQNYDKTFKNWDGRKVRRSRSGFLNKFSLIQMLEQDIPIEDREELFALNYPKVYFIDIETEVIDGFPDSKTAATKILSISIATPEKKIIVLGTKALKKSDYTDIQSFIDEHISKSNEKFIFTYRCFDSEYDLLYTFLHELVPKFPLMTGWNFVGYDWTYIKNRAIRLGIDPAQCSPTRMIDDSSGIPAHVGILDYMDIYKKWDRSVALKENMGLDFTAEAVLGIKKVKYSGSSQELYDLDYKKFISYNAVDSILVHMIHNRIHTLDIVFTLAYLCKVSMYKAASPVNITETLLARKFLEKNLVLAIDDDKFVGAGGKNKQYAGAYVKVPIVGKHKAVACFDFASLYPSIMRQFNISPESFIEKVATIPLRDEDDMVTRKRNREILKKYHEAAKIVSITGAIYDKETSVLKQILDELYSKRREFKKKSWEFETKVDKIKKEIAKRKQSL